MSSNGDISSTLQNLNSNRSNSNFNANGLPNAHANGVSEPEGEGRSNENSSAAVTPSRTSKRKRNPPKNHTMYHRHSQTTGESEFEFEIGLATATAAAVVSPTSRSRKSSTSRKKHNSTRSPNTKKNRSRRQVLATLPANEAAVSVNGAAPLISPTPLSVVNESNIWWKLSQPAGKSVQKELEKAILSEASKNMSNGTSTRRRIDLEVLASMVWSILSFVYIRRFLKTRAKALVQCVFRVLAQKHPDLFRDVLVQESRAYLRKEVFQAWKFQRTIDLYATGGLNYEACNTIRSGVEELPKRKVGVIPAGSTIGRTAKELENHAAEHYNLNIQESTSQHGPSYYFSSKILLRMLLKGYGLDGMAETGSNAKPVLLSWTLDGAQLTNNLGQVVAGVKIVDPRATDPATGLPLCLYQSRDLCFPFQITFGRDCKDLYKDCFNEFFVFFNGQLKVPAEFGLPELSNFDVNSPQDLSSGWKATGLGGGSANSRYPCMACMCNKADLCCYKIGFKRCSLCSRLSIEKCFCHDFHDGKHLNTLKEKLSEYVGLALDDGYKLLDATTKKSQLLSDPTIANRLSNKLHIDFQPSTLTEKKSFNALLKTELSLRMVGSSREAFNAIMTQSLEIRRGRLRELVTEENTILSARAAINHHAKVEGIANKLAVEDFIPCILHMEMRVNEKVFWSLLAQGMDRYLDGDSSTRNLFVNRVTDCVNSHIFGDPKSGRRGQWKFPLKDNGKQVEARSMPNVYSRKCIVGLKSLIPVVFSSDLDQKSLSPQHTRSENELLQSKWLSLLEVYQPMMASLRQQEDFTDEDIDSMHSQNATFMDLWVSLFTGHHVTNYIHILGAGHIHYYLSKYRNLYRYSQQGWEAMNQKLKHFYFNNTNHGGCGGNKNGAMITGEHVRPLMRLCQRFVMWKLGLGDAFFLAKTLPLLDDDDVDEEMQYGEL